MRENTLIKFGVTSLVGVFAFTGSVVAQVDEIIVSAQKRETALVDTPVSVAVVTSKDLEMTEANDLSELQFSVPSVKFTQNQNLLACCLDKLPGLPAPVRGRPVRWRPSGQPVACVEGHMPSCDSGLG